MNTNFISTSKTCLQRYLLPSLTRRGCGVGLCLACLLFCACNDDDDNSGGGSDISKAAYTETAVSEPPQWQIDWNYNQDRPDWTKPDGSLYENWTTLQVQIEETLQPYVSDGDMMALFINGELRGLAKPAIALGSSQVTAIFLMKAYGNETSKETVEASLKYYCQQLKHLFTLSDRISLDSDESTGIDEDYIPSFTLGSAKYPVVKTANVEPMLTKVGITPIQDNRVGAFVGDECRGQVTLSASGITPMVIYGRSVGESVTLKYYDAANGNLYTIPDAVKM